MKSQPMLAETLGHVSAYQYPAYVSEKLDGVRCMMVSGMLVSRTDHMFKSPVQNLFASVAQAAMDAGFVLDGELYSTQVSDFGDLMSTLSAPIETLEAKSLRFHCFDLIPIDEWMTSQTSTPFVNRLAKYAGFCELVDPDRKLIVPVEQHLCSSPTEAEALFDTIAAADGEGIMLRDGSAPYCFGRSSAIAKLKHWLTCEAVILAIHQQACPIKYADEIGLDKNGGPQGFRNTTGSVTVRILDDQPLPAGAIQNATFTGPGAIQLRKEVWQLRESMIGRVVEFQYLKGGNVGRMARITRLRPDKE